MSIDELAKKAGATPYTNRHYPENPHNTFSKEQLETFHRLCIENFVKGVDVEPVGYLSTHTFGPKVFSQTLSGVYPDTATSITPIYTDEQMAAQWNKAIEAAAQLIEQDKAPDDNKPYSAAYNATIDHQAQALRGLKK